MGVTPFDPLLAGVPGPCGDADPLINVKLIEGEKMRPVTWVIVEEVRSEEWGVGGNPMSTADVKALAAGAGPGWSSVS
jgi:phenylpyruvate tautomerase PptA (4-oxalocrotonate tautomerase family)